MKIDSFLELSDSEFHHSNRGKAPNCMYRNFYNLLDSQYFLRSFSCQAVWNDGIFGMKSGKQAILILD